MKHILMLFAVAAFFSCKNVSNGGAESNPDSAARFDNPQGEPGGGGVYSTDSTDHKNMEPQLQGGAEGTGADLRKSDTASGYNNDTSHRIMNTGPGGDSRQTNPDSAKRKIKD